MDCPRETRALVGHSAAVVDGLGDRGEFQAVAWTLEGTSCAHEAQRSDEHAPECSKVVGQNLLRRSQEVGLGDNAFCRRTAAEQVMD